MQRADPLEKSLILEKIKGRSGRGQQWTRWLDDITESMDMNLSNDCSMIEKSYKELAPVDGMCFITGGDGLRSVASGWGLK